MDMRKVTAGSELMAEYPELMLYDRPVPFRLRRRTADGAWLFEIGTPVKAAPVLAGVADERDVRAFAQGILDTIEAWSGEPDFVLFDDGYAEVIATVGYGPELYIDVKAVFDYRQDRVGTSETGEPLYSNVFGGAHVDLGDVSPADPAPLTDFARTVLAALSA